MCGQQLHIKLNGSMGEVEKTTTFILETAWTLSVVFCLPADIVQQNVWPTATHQTLRQRGAFGTDRRPHSSCRLDSQCSILSTCRYNMTKCVANSNPATHQILRQQGRTGEDGHIDLADWTLSLYLCRQDDKICGQQLHTKLYGIKEELEKTASFILQTGHSMLWVPLQTSRQNYVANSYTPDSSATKKEPEKTAILNNNNIHLADWTFSVAAIEKM